MSAELKLNSVNQIMKGTEIYTQGEEVTSMCLVVKGRIRITTEGVNVVAGSGNFLGLCDLTAGEYRVTYTADSDSVIYAFPAMGFNQAVRALIKVNKDYAALLYSTLGKYIRELSRVYDDMADAAVKVHDFIKYADGKYHEIAEKAGITVKDTGIADNLKPYDSREVYGVDSDKVLYYKACCSIPPEIQKAFVNVNPVIPVYHIVDETRLINILISQCQSDAMYLKELAGFLIKNGDNLFTSVFGMAKTMKSKGIAIKEAVSLFDGVIDNINLLENILYDKACIDIEADHKFMEEAYFTLMSGAGSNTGEDGTEETAEEKADVSVLDGSLGIILDYSGVDEEVAAQFKDLAEQFIQLKDKMATEDNVRKIRQGLVKHYYNIYKGVFLKDYKSEEETPLIINLFLKYGFLSEKLVSYEIMEELLELDESVPDNMRCPVYNMKEWLTEIYEGRKEPSKSEFDMDYAENLRDMRKTGRITAEEEKKLARDNEAKFDYEVQNMFKTNHRLIYGQVSVFVPFLFTEGCPGSLKRCYLSAEKINESVNKLLEIDFSAFYREGLYNEHKSPIKKEYIMEEVFPDFIVFPVFGSNSVMWQELSGRKRNSKGRFLVPAFLDTDIDSVMIKLFGRFRWELCRTMQGAAWNNIQIKSLTSEYSDFVQFYRKNRELSDEKKDKLKLQIQKCRNNTREVFVIDYENWIKLESKGGLCLSKPVREILATYCPFSKEIREKTSEQPLFRDAMARFVRERGKKNKEYDLKFRVWQKDKVEVPQQIIDTRDFYLEK